VTGTSNHDRPQTPPPVREEAAPVTPPAPPAEVRHTVPLPLHRPGPAPGEPADPARNRDTESIPVLRRPRHGRSDGTAAPGPAPEEDAPAAGRNAGTTPPAGPAPLSTADAVPSGADPAVPSGVDPAVPSGVDPAVLSSADAALGTESQAGFEILTGHTTITPASAPAQPNADHPVSPAAAPVPPGPTPPVSAADSPTVAAPRERATWLDPVAEPRPVQYAEWPAPTMRMGRPAGYDAPVVTPPRPADRLPRNPATSLPLLVLLALLAAFFGWVSAEPLWLAVGHGTPGTVTVAHCSGPPLVQRCQGTFTGGDFTVADVAVLGVPSGSRAEGTRLPARMVDRSAGRAHASFGGLGLHLRWSLGLTLVFLCGLGIAWATGATRLETRRNRTQAILISLGCPLTLTLGFLIAAW
jgi:hypothetical protein